MQGGRRVRECGVPTDAKRGVGVGWGGGVRFGRRRPTGAATNATSFRVQPARCELSTCLLPGAVGHVPVWLVHFLHRRRVFPLPAVGAWAQRAGGARAMARVKDGKGLARQAWSQTWHAQSAWAGCEPRRLAPATSVTGLWLALAAGSPDRPQSPGLPDTPALPGVQHPPQRTVGELHCHVRHWSRRVAILPVHDAAVLHGGAGAPGGAREARGHTCQTGTGSTAAGWLVTAKPGYVSALLPCTRHGFESHRLGAQAQECLPTTRSQSAVRVVLAQKQQHRSKIRHSTGSHALSLTLLWTHHLPCPPLTTSL